MSRKEKWKVVDTSDGYYKISNRGKIVRIKPGMGTWVGRILNPKINHDGYNHTMLCCGGKIVTEFVHVMVARHFIGPKPKGKEVNHKDLNKQNNCDWNLEYMTHKKNMEHMTKNGVYCGNIGVENGSAKITDRKVRRIRELYSAGIYSQQELGRRFGISQAMVGLIVNHQRWTHI